MLLVADYAETRTGLPAMLTAAAAPGGPVVRVLLLARSAGEWWQQLQRSCPEQVSDLLPGAPVTLGPVAAPASQGEVFAEALTTFAALRGIPCPDARLRPGDADAVVLVVHAAALLAVLDAEDAAAGRTDPAGSSDEAGGDALDRLLQHEHRYWQASLAGWGAVSLDPDVMDRAVTAGCLIGAADQAAAMRLLAVIEDLSDGQLRGKVARWLHDLYPPPRGGEEWIGQLQPDLITEQLVVSVLNRHRELIPALFAGLDEVRARRALTILARAALTQPAALDQARDALAANPAHLLIPAVAVTTETNPALAAAITDAAAALDTAALIPLAEAIPYPTVPLAAVYAAVTRQITATLPPAADPVERAGWLHALGVALSQLGRPAEALPVTEEAVAIRRELAAASPDRYRSALAESLSNLGVRFSALGRPADALPAEQEAVAIRRELAAASPDRYRPDLAASLSNLGIWLSELGRPADALPVTEEAVTTYRELAAASPDRYRPDLAVSLSTLARILVSLGRTADAEKIRRDAAS